MKITFILPGVGKKPGEPYLKSWKGFPPVAIPILKGLTPPDVETEFFDDRAELIDFETSTDLVAMSVESCTALRAYAVARRFRDMSARRSRRYRASAARAARNEGGAGTSISATVTASHPHL